MEDVPGLLLNFTHIKTPQLIGIIAGCSVFVLTISSVVFLLFKSGTLSRFVEEMSSGAPLSLRMNKKEEIAPQSSTLPELYEHLLLAASTLPLQPSLSDVSGERLSLRELRSDDILNLIKASNGSALYGESAYDPARIWGWMNLTRKAKRTESGSANYETNWPCESEKDFQECYKLSSNSQHVVIVDKLTQKQIGMLSLVDNRPEDLNIRIGKHQMFPIFASVLFAPMS